eukprot:PITA_20500
MGKRVKKSKAPIVAKEEPNKKGLISDNDCLDLDKASWESIYNFLEVEEPEELEEEDVITQVVPRLLIGIRPSAKASPLLVGFIDSDWASDPDDRKSTAGYVFTLGSGPITWACKKQAAISHSSVEAEYRGAVEASKEALWLRQILSEFGFQQQHPTTLWCDNQSAIQLCKDPVQHQHSKHIELHMHFIRKLIHDHVLEVQYCSTDDQVADIFTKALTEAKFTKLRFMVGVQEVVTKGG